MPIVFVLVALAVLGVAVVVAAGRGDRMPAPVADRAPLGLPDGRLHADDLAALRFSVGLRGYRMDQVDQVLDRCADELAERDARIAQLQAQVEQAAPGTQDGQVGQVGQVGQAGQAGRAGRADQGGPIAPTGASEAGGGSGWAPAPPRPDASA